MKLTMYVEHHELGRIQHLVKKHNLRWVPGFPWKCFTKIECKITGDVHDFNRFDAELEEIRRYDHPEPKRKLVEEVSRKIARYLNYIRRRIVPGAYNRMS